MTAIERIEAALRAGPSPGPWEVDTSDPEPTLTLMDSRGYAICDSANWGSIKSLERHAVNFEYLHACNPAAITELLAERAALVARVAELEEPKKEKMAPVQGWAGGIPWSLHLEAYAVYCQKWGAQPALIDLEGRNCRGGFGLSELDEFIPGWRNRVSELKALKDRIATLEQENASLRAAMQQQEQTS